jgi:endonuclease YncB( thermonuclease family)
MRPRRIFTPAYHPRPWGAILAGALVAGAVAGLAVALPQDLFGSSPRGQTLRAEGLEVRVVDGETLALGSQVLRLAGVWAPGRGVACHDQSGRSFDCGAAAADALVRVIGGRPVECDVRGRDPQGRALGVCRAGGAELNASLVAEGWGLAGDGSGALLTLEAVAREGRRGLWSAAADIERLRRGF